MDEHLLSIFKLELQYQCELAAAAERQLEAARETGDSDGLWVSLQSILIIAGNCAKLLWGSGRGEAAKEMEVARKPLRDAAQVDENSPLKSRSVRNAFEHWDEKIEAWHRRGDINVYASRHVGQSEAWPPHGSRFGHYNPTTGVVTFLSTSAPIPDLLAEMARIRGILAK